MFLFRKIFYKLIQQDNCLLDYDTRIDCNTKNFICCVPYDTDKIIKLLKKYMSYNKYFGCFLNSDYIKEVAPCLPESYYYKCYVDANMLDNASGIQNFIKSHTFKKCIFFFPKGSLLYSQLLSTTDAELEKFLKNNKLYNGNYVDFLCDKYNNNLSLVKKSKLLGLDINFSNLSEVTLPKNKDFFQCLSSYIIDTSTVLPSINHKDYDLKGIIFKSAPVSK